MPGTIATVHAVVGHAVARGDVLVTIEAMKMETSVRAERDGTVVEVVARPGEQVDAKDLLVVLAEAGSRDYDSRAGDIPRRRMSLSAGRAYSPARSTQGLVPAPLEVQESDTNASLFRRGR